MGRPASDPLDRDAGLHRPAAGLFPRGIPRRARHLSAATCGRANVGSWAGAFGPTQFMPTAFKRYAVDFDRDGRRNVVEAVPDLIASTANHLKRDGWSPVRPGATRSSSRRLQFHARRPIAAIPCASGRSSASSAPTANRSRGRATMPFCCAGWCAGTRLPDAGNFRAIMKYNPAEAYALAIGHLADRLRGGGPFAQHWPRDERCSRARSGWNCSNVSRATVRCRRTGRPARSEDPRRDAPIPGQSRRGLSDGFASAGHPGPAARRVNDGGPDSNESKIPVNSGA